MPRDIIAELAGQVETAQSSSVTEDSKPEPARWIERRAVLRRFSDVQPELLQWLWPGRIPLGMVTIFSGNPGAGKSFAVADIVSRVSTGAKWPDGTENDNPGDAVLMNVEDHVSATQRPRLDAARANVARISRIEAVEVTSDDETVTERTFSLSNSATVLRSAIEQLDNPRIVVLDPLAAFLAGVRSNDQGEIRDALSPLVQLAEETGIAVVIVHHNRKGSGTHSSERLSGSLQIGATVRQSWEFFLDSEDAERRLFLPGKNSNARDRGGLAFRVVDSEIPLSDGDDFVGRVEWEPSPVAMSADDAARESHDQESGDSWPVEWLKDFLGSAAVAACEVKREARKESISDKQLRTAGKKLGIKPYKSDFKGGWVWQLPSPEDALPDVEDAQDART